MLESPVFKSTVMGLLLCCSNVRVHSRNSIEKQLGNYSNFTLDDKDKLRRLLFNKLFLKVPEHKQKGLTYDFKSGFLTL